jgi:hypothetical protein
VKTGEFYHVVAEFEKNPQIYREFYSDELKFMNNPAVRKMIKGYHNKVVKSKKKLIINNFSEEFTNENIPAEYLDNAKSLAVFPILGKKNIAGTMRLTFCWRFRKIYPLLLQQ